MAWCPKCKEEYEDHIEMCADCKVPLVPTLEDIPTDRMLLVVNSREEAEKALEFLKYSDIDSGVVKDAKNEHDEHVYVIYVHEDIWEKAAKLMQGFVSAERDEPDMEDYYFDEYDTHDIEGEDHLAEIKSSYVAFIGLGGVLALVGILNLVGVLGFLRGNMPLMFTVIGVVFVGIGFYTKSNMTSKVDAFNTRRNEFERVYRDYTDKYPLDKFADRQPLNLADMDEGARYFAVMDRLVKEIKTMDLTEDEKMINTVAEKVYHQL